MLSRGVGGRVGGGGVAVVTHQRLCTYELWQSNLKTAEPKSMSLNIACLAETTHTFSALTSQWLTPARTRSIIVFGLGFNGPSSSSCWASHRRHGRAMRVAYRCC